MLKAKYAMRLLCLVLIPAIGHAGEVRVKIALATPDSVEVSYTLPAECKSLPFVVSDDAEPIRASWQSSDACGTASGDTLNRSDNTAARDALKRQGISIDPVSAADRANWEAIGSEVFKQLSDSGALSPEMVKALTAALAGAHAGTAQ